MTKLDMKQAKEFVLALPAAKGVHTLKKIALLLEKFDNPQDKIKVIHLAGTNGKGSTSNMLASVFSAKYKTGLFTSPYMLEINENISINGKNISDVDFADLVNRLKDYVKELAEKEYYLSYFEVLTAMMYIYFYEQKVDIAIVETGLGGLLDCTNIIKKPLASVITTISMDHMNILGETIEEIAYQKAGIIKENSPVFLYPQSKEVFQIFSQKAKEKNSKLYTFTKDEINIQKSDENSNIFDFRDYKDVKIGLVGNHQIFNASLALMVMDYFKDEFNLEREAIKKSLAKAKNIGRLTTICKNPRIIIDGAHNREAIDALIKFIDKLTYDKLIIGFSVLKDKDYDYIIKSLSQKADKLIVTSLDNPRAFEFEELLDISKKYFPNPIALEDRKKAYQYAKNIAGPKDLVIWCGSLYLISEFINYEK